MVVLPSPPTQNEPLKSPPRKGLSRLSDAIDTSGLVKKTDYDVKVNEVKGKIPSIIGLVTTTAFHVINNEISTVSDLVKKTDYDLKISDIEDKYFTISDYNKFTNEIVDAKMKK